MSTVKLFFTLLSCTFSICGYAQVDKLMDAAEEQYELSNIGRAIEIYSAALPLSSKYEASIIHYRLGICYSDLLRWEDAILHYQTSYKKDRAYKEALFDIAIALRRNEQYEASRKYFKKYARQGEDKAKAERELQAHDLIISARSSPSDYQVSLVEDISTPFYDYSPQFIDPEKNTLVFTSSRLYEDSLSQVALQSNLFYTTLNESTWASPILLDTAINRVNNEGTLSIDHDRNVVFYTRCYQKSEEDYRCDIFFSFLRGELAGESMQVPFEKPDEPDMVHGHPSFSNELDLLFFVSDRPGGYGGKDIWFTEYQRETDSWKTPRNAGPEVNTSQDEFFPFIAPDGTLYYSSNGRLSMGGLDIFKASQRGQGYAWGNVERLPYPINSSGDDFGIIFSNELGSGYFSSNRKGGLGMDDIYHFRLKQDSSVFMDTSRSLAPKDSTLHALAEVLNKEKCLVSTESSQLSLFKVYPNPSSGLVTYELEVATDIELSIRGYNAKGEVVYLETIRQKDKWVQRQLDLSKQPTGIYYLQVLHDCKVLDVRKLIIE